MSRAKLDARTSAQRRDIYETARNPVGSIWKVITQPVCADAGAVRGYSYASRAETLNDALRLLELFHSTQHARLFMFATAVEPEGSAPR